MSGSITYAADVSYPTGQFYYDGTRVDSAVVPVQRGRRDVQMHLLLYGQGADGGRGTLKADLTPDAHNLFWQRSLNLGGNAAFVLARNNAKAAQIVPGVDHIEVWRETPTAGAYLVFQGKVGEPSIGPRDVVYRALDYLSYLQKSRSGYKTYYRQKKVGTEIIAPEWALAKGVDRGPLNFVATGTIEDPLGLDGVTPVKTNDKFGLMDQDRLFLFYALAEMAMTNTDYNVVFEITLSHETPTFNFFKDRSTDRTNFTLQYPGNLVSFNYAPGFLQLSNDLASVVKKAGGGQEEYQVDDTTSIDTYRRLQEAVSVSTLMGLDTAGAEADQMKLAVRRLLADRIRLPKLFVAIPRQGEVDPFVGWNLGDNIKTFIEQAGSTDVDELNEYLRVISVAAAWRPDSGEGMQLYLRGK